MWCVAVVTGKRYRDVKIGDCNLIALIDTGRELTLTGMNRYVKIEAPKFDEVRLKDVQRTE